LKLVETLKFSAAMILRSLMSWLVLKKLGLKSFAKGL